MISVDGAALVAQILPIAILIIAFESRPAYSGINDPNTRNRVSSVAVTTFAIIGLGLIWCVSIVVFRIRLEGGWAILANLGVFVPFLISVLGTAFFLSITLNTMYTKTLKNATQSERTEAVE
jgi:hypothetical protein